MISVELASCEVGQLAELAMGKLRGALTCAQHCNSHISNSHFCNLHFIHGQLLITYFTVQQSAAKVPPHPLHVTHNMTTAFVLQSDYTHLGCVRNYDTKLTATNHRPAYAWCRCKACACTIVHCITFTI